MENYPCIDRYIQSHAEKRVDEVTQFILDDVDNSILLWMESQLQTWTDPDDAANMPPCVHRMLDLKIRGVPSIQSRVSQRHDQDEPPDAIQPNTLVHILRSSGEMQVVIYRGSYLQNTYFLTMHVLDDLDMEKIETGEYTLDDYLLQKRELIKATDFFFELTPEETQNYSHTYPKWSIFKKYAD